MKWLKNKLRNTIFANHFKQEYICVSSHQFKDPLRVMLQCEGSSELTDVSSLHLFIGYKPVLVGLPCIEKHVVLHFTDSTHTAFGTLNLKLVNSVPGNHFSIYEGTDAVLHNDRNSILKKYIYNSVSDKQHELFIPWPLYKQIKLLYSIPRNISLICLEKENRCNVFPTDLHGAIGNGYYIISLRHKGNANKQVLANGKLVLSNMPVTSFKDVYMLGKNHIKELSHAGNFSILGNETTEQFMFPIPKGAVSYMELELIQSNTVHGIHQLHLFKVVNKKILRKESSLAHIHESYAWWRKQSGYRDELFLR